MNNETHLDATALIFPEILEAVKGLQTPGFIPDIKRQLEEIVDYIIDDEMDSGQIQVLTATSHCKDA
jgi:hypothetical protein